MTHHNRDRSAAVKASNEAHTLRKQQRRLREWGKR